MGGMLLANLSLAVCSSSLGDVDHCEGVMYYLMVKEQERVLLLDGSRGGVHRVEVPLLE